MSAHQPYQGEPDFAIGRGEPLDVPVESDGKDNVVVMKPGAVSQDTASMQIAKTFVEGVLSGKSPKEAARDAGTTTYHIRKDGLVRLYILENRERLAATADELRQYVLMKWIDTVESTVDPKERMAALHEISRVPETGLKIPKAKQELSEISDETRAVLDELDD